MSSLQIEKLDLDEHALKLTSVDLKSRRLTENQVIESHSAAEVLWT